MTNTKPLIGKRVHDTQEMLGDGTVLDYDVVEALVKWDTDRDPLWSHWDDLEFIIVDKKSLSWQQIARLTNTELSELLETEDIYDDVTMDLAVEEQANREEDASMASEHQASYDEFWSRF